jgi:hypothetical protein
VTRSTEINILVQEILADMSLKEKAAIASLSHEDISRFHELFDNYLSGQLGQDNEMSRDVMHRIWEMLQETHRIRSVSKSSKHPANQAP